jgi:hypothetical protein
MEYVKDIEQREIIVFHLDIQKDKRDAVYVKFLSIGLKITVLVVNLNFELDHFVGLELGEKSIENR